MELNQFYASFDKFIDTVLQNMEMECQEKIYTLYTCSFIDNVFLMKPFRMHKEGCSKHDSRTAKCEIFKYVAFL